MRYLTCRASDAKRYMASQEESFTPAAALAKNQWCIQYKGAYRFLSAPAAAALAGKQS